jgi:hypothetical protein
MSVPYLLLALLLPACTTAVGGLPYTSTAAVSPYAAGPAIGRVVAIDQRGEAPRHIGAVRGGFGNPIKTIETVNPVKEEIAHAFQDALRKRGLIASHGDGFDVLTVTVLRMDCSQYVRREAHADFQIALTDPSGRPIYQDNVKVTVVDGSRMAMDVGIFGNPEDLRAVAIQAMSMAIDQALDKAEISGAFRHEARADRLSSYRLM